MSPSKDVTEVIVEVNIVTVSEVKRQKPISLVEFFSEAPRANLEIPVRTINDDDRKVDF